MFNIDATNGISTMSEWADIDIFVGGLAIGLAIGGLLAWVAIQAFKTGVRQGIDRRAKEDEEARFRPISPWIKCTKCGEPFMPVMLRFDPKLRLCTGCQEGDTPPPPPPPPADEDPGRTVKSA